MWKPGHRLLPQLFYCNKYQPVEVEKNDNKRMQGRSEEVSGPPQNYQTDVQTSTFMCIHSIKQK